jgi:hypothetical protein
MSKTIGININWYVWQNEFYLASNVSSYGGYTPIVSWQMKTERL